MGNRFQPLASKCHHSVGSPINPCLSMTDSRSFIFFRSLRLEPFQFRWARSVKLSKPEGIESSCPEASAKGDVHRRSTVMPGTLGGIGHIALIRNQSPEFFLDGKRTIAVENDEAKPSGFKVLGRHQKFFGDAFPQQAPCDRINGLMSKVVFGRIANIKNNMRVQRGKVDHFGRLRRMGKRRECP